MDIATVMNDAQQSIQTHIEDTINHMKSIVQNEFSAQLESMIKQIEILTQENSTLKSRNDDLLKHKVRLETHVENMEEDHRNFTKVSHLIALQNDNSRLSNENKLLMVQLQNTKIACNNTISNDDAVPTKKEDISPLPHHEPPNEPSNEPCDVQEKSNQSERGLQHINREPTLKDASPEQEMIVKKKKIGKNVYYVDSENTVYAKLDDDGVGDKVGQLVKDNGVTRVVWNSVS